MVRCRSRKCLERQRKIVNQIMLKVPEIYRFDYEQVKKHAKPFVQKREWRAWVRLQENIENAK